MRHTFIYILVCGFILINGCAHIRLKKELHVDTNDWHTVGGNTSRSHTVSTTVDPPLVEKWRFDVGAGVGLGGTLVIDEVVLVGTRKGQVLAIDIHSGKRLGRVRFDAPVEGGMTYSDGTLYIPMITKKKTLIAYDINADEQRWRLNTTPIESGLLVANNVLITVDSDGFIRGWIISTVKCSGSSNLGSKLGLFHLHSW